MMYLNFAESPAEQRTRHVLGSAMAVVYRFHVNRYALVFALSIVLLGGYAVATNVIVGMKAQGVRFAAATAEATRPEALRVKSMRQQNTALKNYDALFGHAALTGNAWAVQVARIGDAIAGERRSPSGVWVDSLRAADGLNQGWIVDGKAASSGRLASAIERLDHGNYLSSYPTWSSLDKVTAYHVDLFPENVQIPTRSLR